MEKYDEYKDSGVEWIGEVPNEWNLRKLKFVLPTRTDKRIAKDSNLFYVGMESVESFTGRFIEGGEEAEGLANYFLRGDILFGKLRPYLCKVYQADFIGLCSTEFIVYKSSNGFFQKLLSSPSFINLVQSSTYGSKMPRANPEWINNQYLPIPSEPTQTAIATFLDRKTAQVDRAIAQKERLIALLRERKQIVIQQAVTKGLDPTVKMKDSGVEWIGDIPEHWEVSKAKYYSKIFVPERAKPELDVNKAGVPWVTTKDLGKDILDVNSIKYSVSPISIRKTGSRIIKKDSVLATCVGNFGIASINRVECIVNQQLQGFTDLKIEALWLVNIIRLSKDYFSNNATMTTIQYVNKETFGDLPITVLPKEEQKKIIEFILRKSSKIDQSIHLHTQQITKLKEYRTVLIDAAVTGKIRVE